MKGKLTCLLVSVFLIIIYDINLHAADLRWDISTGEVSGYTIYYGLSQGSYSFSEDVGNVTQYSLDNFSLIAGTTYYFVVRAYNEAGESGNSNVMIYTVPSVADTTPPIPPVDVLGEILEQDIVLGWQSNNEIDIFGYNVYFGTSSRNYGLPTPVGGTEYSIAGLDVDVTYYIAVTAVDTSGNESGYSSPEIVIIIPTAVEEPIVEGSIIKWDPAAGDVSGYIIYYGISEGVYTESVDVGEMTQYALDALPLISRTTYYFVVRAYNEAGESDNSNVVMYFVGGQVDIEPPLVSITLPTNDSSYYTETASLDIGGTASDAIGVTQVTWSNSAGGNGTASGTDNWNATGISLTEGTNIITITVRDAVGNESTDQLTVTYVIPDTTEPVIVIISPTSDASYNTEVGNVTLSGTASDNKAVTHVTWTNSAGGNSIASGTDNWSIVGIGLTEGENIIAVTARDEAGNESTDVLTVTYTIPDTTAPVVTITSPTTDLSYYTETASLDIGGTASDAIGVTHVTWTNSAGGNSIASGTDNWSIVGIGLTEGENIIAVTARDEAGNESTDVLTVTYTIPDTTAPVVTITSPTTDLSYYTETASLDIGGTASDAIGVTQVTWSNSAGGNGTASGTDNWNATGISLTEGTNIITITVRDAVGNESTDQLTVTYVIPDTTEPVIVIISPTSDASYNTEVGNVTLSGTASDNKAVTHVTWTNSAGGNSIASGTDNWSIAGIGLTEGENIIAVTARDEAGNESTDVLTVTYTIPDTTAPVVTITSPTTDLSYYTETASLDIGGTASDAIGVTHVTWTNSAGGNSIASGTDNWSIAGIGLTEGENIIAVTARDEAGNESTDVLTVTYTIPDTTAPVVTITSPTTDLSYYTETASLDIGGTASDAIGVTQVTWSNSAGGNGIASGTDNWSIAGIGLTEGENIIAVTARDEAGNESTDVLTVTYTIPDTTAPVVTITSPTTDLSYYTETASLDIGGTASDAIGVTQVTWSNSAGGNGTASGTDNWNATGISLTEGTNIITITVRDAVGNESTDQLTVTYVIPDTTEPVIVIISPTSDASYNTGVGNITLSGTASDNKAVTHVTWTNSAGGNGIASGTDNWSIAGLGLTEGENIIAVTARDEAGNKSSDSITIQYTAQTIDTTPPVISVNSPTTGRYLFTRSASVSLSGNASDDIGIKEILWNNSKGGSGKASGTSDWSASDIALAKYWNTITITAIDFSGNKSVYALSVFSWY